LSWEFREKLWVKEVKSDMGKYQKKKRQFGTKGGEQGRSKSSNFFWGK